MRTQSKMMMAAGTALLCAAPAFAGQSYNFSSDTEAGQFVSFDWDGGDQGTLQGAMEYAANRNGNFADMETRRNQVNLFLVDFTTANTNRYDGAGLTLFVMFGNDNAADGPFVASADMSPSITEGADDGDYSGNPRIFALGAGVTIDDDGPVSVDVDVDGTTTPVGFAITNIGDVSGFGETGRVNLQLTLAQAIRGARLIGAELGTVWQAVDDDGSDNVFTDGVVLFTVIPAPPAALFGLAGLGGLTLVSRRRRK